MKSSISVVAFAALIAPFGPGCSKSEKKVEDNLQPAVVTQEGHAAAPAGHGKVAPAGHGQAGAPAGHGGAEQGKSADGAVTETMNAGGYTYVLVDSKDGKLWAAAPETVVKVGDKVSFAGGMPMEGFRSNSLERTFDLVYFVPSISINGAAIAAAPSAGKIPAPSAAPVELKKITKAEGGKTIAELFAAQAELGGKSVTLRGQVVKFNGGIMGSNWIHIKDGTGAEGSNDLTVTTQGTAKVGDVVLVKGIVGLAKDFGGGYKYDVMVEEATVTVE